MTQTGWRKPTPELGAATQLVRAGEQNSYDKTRCIVAVKRVSAQIGVKAADFLLLDTLAAFSQPQDWAAGQRPIVWPSNAFLMAQTGFSLSTLKRHARRLAALGLIAFQDSPNGKRWGHRDCNGHIVEAYGFDLSPLSARCVEFEDLAAQTAAELAACRRLKRQITILRRSLRAYWDACADRTSCEETAGMLAAFEELVSRIPTVAHGVERLTKFYTELSALRDQVLGDTTIEMTVEDQTDTPDKLAPREVETDPHIQFTKQHYSVTEKTASELLDPRITRVTNEEDSATLDNLLAACPEFSAWAQQLGKERNLREAASMLAPMVGVPPSVWNDTCSNLGEDRATTAFALMFEKAQRAEIVSPVGYLRGMVRKADIGELHLARSIAGRLKRYPM